MRIDNERVFYRDVDRIIRIIYKEMNMLEHFRYYQEGLANFNFSSFELSNDIFRHRVKRSYFKLYPNNYHVDDIEMLLEELTDLLKKEYNSTNAIYLIFYVGKKMIHRNLNNFFINFEELLEWDGFINKVDMKLFVAAKLVELNMPIEKKHTSSVISHNNHYLHDIFERNKISENHMHLKASGYVTDINWHSFLSSPLFDYHLYKDFISSDGIFEDIAKDKNHIRNNGDEKNLIQYLIKIKVLRIILESIRAGNSKYSETAILQVLNSEDVEVTLQTLTIEEKLLDDEERPVPRMLATQVISDLERFLVEPSILFKQDTSKYSFIEINFLKDLFAMIANKNNERTVFLTFLLNMYICGMTDLKFQFLQDNLGMGFAKFKEKEDNKKIFVKERQANQDIMRSAFHKYYREGVIKNIEFRVGPEEEVSEYLDFLETLHKMNEEEFERAKIELSNPLLLKINYGVIIHFIKFKNRGSIVDNNIDKREQLESLSERLLDTLRVIEREPDEENIYKNRIVGIDTANYEFDNRPNIYACIFRKMRYDKSIQQDLYATYHVGEEFPTLANGVRAIDEVLSYCAYRENDRLGHALALGMSAPDYFSTKRSKIMCSVGDYIDDIIWLYSMFTHSDSSADKNYLPYLRSEFEQYKHLLFDSSFGGDYIPTFEDYYDSYFLRGDSPEIHRKVFEMTHFSYDHLIKEYTYQLNNQHFYHKHAFLNKKARFLYLRFTFDEEFNKVLNSPFNTKVTDIYIECVTRSQEILKQKILRMGIFIEANPTSNKKISYIDQYIKLPALKLNSYGLSDDNDQVNLPISINTDDSSIFQTNLTNEYSMIAAALMREGYSRQGVNRYIEELAIASNVHSFIGKNL
ncbi:hypothetical protein ACFQOY_10010 [Enterococcus alcedinis]|uniref:Adenosine deaminase domain-containing protein n=1 Tax=Enterococcus alcedinis TaxID=1274384 RepID=A0A917N4E6_9ENTE|nr:hypothetical protein [Enterococcus alcedinis]MBP2102083.1 adenosine deaminase [Enterococcus alcedinis]GGI65645.1 hypothetical protein GCM10011482_12990 [Enterococcus alcedinis]